jgi:hypothetical protein
MLANHPSEPNNQPKHMLNIKNYLQTTRKFRCRKTRELKKLQVNKNLTKTQTNRIKGKITRISLRLKGYICKKKGDCGKKTMLKR